jgi:hypothetical protein
MSDTAIKIDIVCGFSETLGFMDEPRPNIRWSQSSLKLLHVVQSPFIFEVCC